MGGQQTWICCQLGAREHYSIPRALHFAGRRTFLVTDVKGVMPEVLGYIPWLRRFAGRVAEGFPNENVRAATTSAVSFRMGQRLGGEAGWDLVVSRNLWFERVARAKIEAIRAREMKSGEQATLFTYSYTALGCVALAKEFGWRTVVGAIDPGVAEERIVAAEVARNPDLDLDWKPAPAVHWQRWKDELMMADHVVVNSRWSEIGLTSVGVPRSKIAVIPLAYEPSQQALQYHRAPISSISHSRPLKVLFLGQVVLRKGMAAILRAVDLLGQAPVEFLIVGPLGMRVPPRYQNHPRIRWVGPVTRDQVSDYFRAADVFLFPTHSDGFGLTQLEAFSWGLPIIASQFCGEVVHDGENGFVLNRVSPEEIASTIERIISFPEILDRFAKAVPRRSYGLGDLASDLESLRMSKVN